MTPEAPYSIIEGDCLDVLRGMDAGSVDAIVTDPPYGFGFMGRAWDATVPDAEAWRECLRVLPPGGHLLAFGGPRTYHRLAVAVEEAGFEIRDQIMWLFGQGFPKSHNLKNGHTGWGTALKPAHEPVVLARKPLAGTVAANVEAHGTGALNIDASRVPVDGSELVEDDGRRVDLPRGTCAEGYDRPNATMYRTGKPAVRGGPSDARGRYPANVIHDGSPDVMEAFAQFGRKSSNSGTPFTQNGGADRTAYGKFAGYQAAGYYGDTGTAARFFYAAKASKKEREAGLPSPEAGRANTHPTVKPLALMSYLCRLVTPPGGTVLDPFAGSGSTGCAAAQEGFRFIGIEREAEYAEIARQRCAHAYAEHAHTQAEMNL